MSNNGTGPLSLNDLVALLNSGSPIDGLTNILRGSAPTSPYAATAPPIARAMADATIGTSPVSRLWHQLTNLNNISTTASHGGGLNAEEALRILLGVQGQTPMQCPNLETGAPALQQQYAHLPAVHTVPPSDSNLSAQKLIDLLIRQQLLTQTHQTTAPIGAGNVGVQAPFAVAPYAPPPQQLNPDQAAVIAQLLRNNHQSAAPQLPEVPQAFLEARKPPAVGNLPHWRVATHEAVLNQNTAPLTTDLRLATKEVKRRSGRSGSFPQKLHQMLTDLEQQGSDVASFSSHGRSFSIHKPKEFVRDVMPKYCRMSRYTSFQRQLALYNIRRITEGPNKGSYCHELFVRGRPILATMINRNKSKASKKVQVSSESGNTETQEENDEEASLTSMNENGQDGEM